MVFGVIVGLIVAALVSSVPVIGALLAPLVVAFGLAQGALEDVKDSGLRGRVAAGAALPEVEVAVVKPPAQAPKKPSPQKTKKQTPKRRGRKRKRQQRGAVDEEEEEEEEAETEEGGGAVAVPAAAATPAEVRSAVLARVLGMLPPPLSGGDGKSPVAAAAIAQAQAGEEKKSGPVVFPRELFVELEALMGVRWADAWRG